MNEVERERWRGRVDEAIRNMKDDISTLYDKAGTADSNYNALGLKVQTVAVKIGIFSSIGAFLGGGIMAIVVSLFRH